MSRAELMTINGSKYNVPAILRLIDAEAVAAYSGTVRAGIELVARLIRDLQAENAELRVRLAETERDADQLLKERDYAEGMADKLADALATMLCVDIGEHSSGNCPWTEALEAFEERATDSAAEQENDA